MRGTTVTHGSWACAGLSSTSRRRKDAFLQEHGYLVLRSLAEGLGTRLDAVFDEVLRAFVRRTGRRMTGSGSVGTRRL